MPAKATLRRTSLAQRQALTATEVTQRSDQLRAQFFQHFPVAQWRWLHVFLPLLAKNEPDIRLLVRQLWAQGLPTQLAAPVVQPDGISLKHYALTPTTPLLTNRWGIAEPVANPATEVALAQLDAVLVPLLACDARGQRVGYGGGFYDRFLAQCRPDTVFIGLNILDEAPGAEISDVLPTDIPLHAYLTPSGVWNF